MKDLSWYIIWATGVLLILSICGVVHAEEGPSFAPGHNPTIEQDGQTLDICRVAAGAAQNFLLLTDQMEQKIHTRPHKDDEELRRYLDDAKKLMEAVERTTGELEIASSVCLGLPIDPKRLSPEQQEYLEKARKNPKRAA